MSESKRIPGPRPLMVNNMKYKAQELEALDWQINLSELGLRTEERRRNGQVRVDV